METSNGLEVNIKQVGGGRLNGNFVLEEEIERPKITIAYDMAGNAIECDLQDILDKKLRPNPHFDMIEQTEVKTDKKKTRSGKTYDA
jgi:hypothetical protein